MTLDIGGILKDWPFEPGQVNVRLIQGADGREKIQLRMDLGLLQMETTGRPDGQRPHGFENLLAYHQHRLQQHQFSHGGEEGFELDEKECELIRAEGMMYYHRYLAEFILEDYEAVERDTVHNLEMMDFCRLYAKEESDRYVLEQYRPYVLMMCTRARGRMALRNNRARSALAVVKKGIAEIEDFYLSFGQEDLARDSGEMAILTAMAKEIESRIPVDPLKKLRQKLARAVEEERYEDAASLRNRIDKLTHHRPSEAE